MVLLTGIVAAVAKDVPRDIVVRLVELIECVVVVRVRPAPFLGRQDDRADEANDASFRHLPELLPHIEPCLLYTSRCV